MSRPVCRGRFDFPTIGQVAANMGTELCLSCASVGKDCFALGPWSRMPLNDRCQFEIQPDLLMKTILAPLLLSLAVATTVLAEWPINDSCPVDGKAARPIYRVRTAEGPVAFCCVTCMQTFEKSPGKYSVKKKDAPK